MAIARQIVTMAPTAAAANSICASQSPGAGAITINGTLASGGVATLDMPRRVLLTSGGADSGITFTITGTNRTGNVISETVQGVNNPATVTTTQDFKTVTSITHTGTVAGTLLVGTVSATTAASSEWIALNTSSNPMHEGIAVYVTGTVNYTVEYTYDDINAPYSGTFPTAFNISGGSLTAKTATADSQANPFNFPIWAVRLTINSYTAGATVKMTVLQSGIGGQ